jgi:hypothetical protein
MMIVSDHVKDKQLNSMSSTLIVSDHVKDKQLNSMSSTFHKDEVDSSKQRPVASMLMASIDIHGLQKKTIPFITVPEGSESGTRNDVTD